MKRKSIEFLAIAGFTALILTSCIGRTGTGVNQNGGDGVTQNTTKGSFDPNAKSATTVNPLNEGLARVQGLFKGQVVPSANNAFQTAVNQVLNNLPNSSDPSKFNTASATAILMLMHGACTQAAGTPAFLTTYGLTSTGTVASQSAKLVQFGVAFFFSGIGVDPANPPSATPNLAADMTTIFTSHVNSLVSNSATVTQAIASVCLDAGMGAISAGF